VTDRKRIAAALLSTCVLMLVAAVPGWAARTVRVGSHPVATAFGGGAAWVANKGDGTVTPACWPAARSGSGRARTTW